MKLYFSYLNLHMYTHYIKQLVELFLVTFLLLLGGEPLATPCAGEGVSFLISLLLLLGHLGMNPLNVEFDSTGEKKEM